jgi:hypothetical protein
MIRSMGTTGSKSGDNWGHGDIVVIATKMLSQTQRGFET